MNVVGDGQYVVKYTVAVVVWEIDTDILTPFERVAALGIGEEIAP